MDQEFWLRARVVDISSCFVLKRLAFLFVVKCGHSGCRAGSLVKLTVEGMRFILYASTVGVVTIRGALTGVSQLRLVAALLFPASQISSLSARWFSSVGARKPCAPSSLILAFMLAPWSFVAAS